MNRLIRHLPPFLAAVLALSAPLSPASGLRDEEQKPSAEELEFFDARVLPILEAGCFPCHGGKKSLRGHFRITSRAGLIKGGERGPAINLGEPKKSLLLEMVSYKDEDHEMPPDGRLPVESIAILERWVAMGAPFDPAREIHGPEEEKDDFDPTAVNEKTKEYWAFRPISAPAVPRVDDPAWQANPIDAFIYSRVAANGLTPNPPADRRELIRRASYDLIGLPPGFDEVRAFVEDASPDAFEKVVDRLLRSPRYGEKWARHWLDLVRYAESNGYERDSVKPMAWGYRDYVIRAFNENKPYDQFLREQLAGDELDDVTLDCVAATGYHRLGLWDDEPVDRDQARYDYLDSIAATTGEVMLGLTVGCARCHDHKIDPLPQKDYYRFLAFFANISPHGNDDANLVPVVLPEDAARLAEERRDKAEREARLQEEIYAVEQSFLDAARERTPELVTDLAGPADITDLRYRFYRDTWEMLPDFEALRPETEGRIAHGRFTLEPSLRREAMGLVFDGKLRVPAKGTYAFRVEAKDGSRLVVGDELVGEHAGTGRHRYEKSIELDAGYVPVRLEYFNLDGTPSLDVTWSGVGSRERPLARVDDGGGAGPLVSDARQDAPSAWQYRFREPRGKWKEPGYEGRGWKTGLGGFGARGAPGAIVRTEWTTREIWMRSEFEVRGEAGDLSLTIHHDEDAEVWINGSLVAELKGTDFKGTDFKGSDFKGSDIKGTVTRYRSLPLGGEARSALREGTNAIAVHCRQTGEGQYIDVGLSAPAGPASLSERIAEHGEDLLGQETWRRYFALKADLEESRAREPRLEPLKVMAVGERGRHPMHVLLRGNPNLRGEEVQPGFPSVLSPPEPGITDRGDTSGRRRALAEWVTSPDKPLTARVAVNRLWQFHFGRGIVRSSSNFGRIGDRPTHPDLLDWLARTFIESGWDLKAMHRRMMLSRAYRMSSRGRAGPLEKDPQNDLLWRFDMRRLTAEEIRDSMLLATGRLNLKMFGPSIYPELPPDVLATSSTGAEKWGTSPQEERSRRSIYIFIRRSLQDPMLTTFDFADTDSSCAVRFSTTVPTQALTMLNSQFVNDQAEMFAARLTREARAAEEQVRRGIEIATSRPATAEDVEAGVKLLEEFRGEFGAGEQTALARYCLLLLNLNEFLFVD